MNNDVTILVTKAEQAAGNGQWGEAERLWLEVVRLAPDYGRAHHRIGIHAFQRGAFVEAEAALMKAWNLLPPEPMVALMLANVRREMGQIEGELAALQAALAADPYFYPALLARGAAQERLGQHKLAATTYQNVIKIAPPEANWPDSLRSQLLHARATANAHSARMMTALSRALSEDVVDPKWLETVSIMAGRSKPYHSDCNQLHIPRLPAIPFFDPSHFPWVDALEAKTEAIKQELEAMLRDREDAFTPYITYRPGDPVNQWLELNHSKRWASLSLWRGGVREEVNCAACPQTAAALASIDMAEIGGLCPNVMFSVLAPHTQIPPHHGETNARLVVHLPLIVPPNCHYRVGFEERQWEVGKVLMFDDTIEHTARNDSDEPRVILIFDIWNPLLTQVERAQVQALTRAAQEFAGS
jgi:aspartyl/asparaginyl beta-hydroxylase (cupin superfamily)